MRKIAFCIAFIALYSLLSPTQALACSVFVLADADHIYFGNNEDFENGNTYVWFVPAGKGTYGAALFSYEDAWVEGGMNEMGLALDWAVTEPQRMAVDPKKPSLIGDRNRLYFGNITEMLLRSCATLDDVVTLLGKYNEYIFEENHLLVADKTGASAILEWYEGEFQVIRRDTDMQIITNINTSNAQKSNYSYTEDNSSYSYTRYFAIRSALEAAGSVCFDASRIALAAGSDYMTQYSYICDLKNGCLTLYDKRKFAEGHNVALADELKKGPQIYTTDMGPFAVNAKYRNMGPINNQNPMAVGRGRQEILVSFAISAVMMILCAWWIKKSRAYILPAIADALVLPVGLGLMRYGYFLRYGFTVWQSILLWLPVAYVALSASLIAVAALQMLRRGTRAAYIPLAVNAVLCAVISVELVTNVLL